MVMVGSVVAVTVPTVEVAVTWPRRVWPTSALLMVWLPIRSRCHH
jgi:hypothetical protein